MEQATTHTMPHGPLAPPTPAEQGPRLRIGTLELKSRVIPAPMCNISDRPQRSLSRRMGADLVCTQMISAEGLIRNDPGTARLLDIEGEEPPVEVQLVGSQPDRLAEAARILEEKGASLIDLNMGCPARNVTGNDCGSALMRNPQLVAEIVRTVKAAVRVPFTVKMRAGWDEAGINAVDLARICEGEGANAVTLHARTRKQGYSGHADWTLITAMKQALTVPVIGNGDITSPADAVRMFRETGCDAVMLGRGIIGNPWLLRACEEASHAYFTGRIRDEAEVPGDELVSIEEDGIVKPMKVPYYMRDVSVAERLDLVIHHTRLMVEAKGERRGVIEMRKHSQQYIKAIPGCKLLRTRLLDVESLAGVEALVAEYREYLAGH